MDFLLVIHVQNNITSMLNDNNQFIVPLQRTIVLKVANDLHDK